jgi:hypothetical protein
VGSIPASRTIKIKYLVGIMRLDLMLFELSAASCNRCVTHFGQLGVTLRITA